jgi:hypothetical protein
MALPSLESIRDEDLREFCEFLHENLSRRIPAGVWAEAFQQDWGVKKPNNGFLIRDAAGRIVGGIGAIYAEQMIRGQPERFCNITSWCVLEPYRSHSLRLAMAVISQPGFHFTDLTPTPLAADSLRFLKFKPMDGRVTVLPNLPWWSPGVRAVSDPGAIEQMLAPRDAKVYRDHRSFPWLNHVAVGRPGNSCHVIYKKGILKRIPCAVVLYASDPDLFLRYRFTLGRYFLFRHGMASTRVESRFLPRRPRLSAQVGGYYNKMFRSDSLGESDVQNLYTELMSLDQ